MFSMMVTNLVVFVLVLLATESFGSDNEYLVPFDVSGSKESFIYNDTEIIICNMKKSWQESLHICKSMHAKLVNLDSQEKATFFGEILAETELGLEDVWVGARRDSYKSLFGYLWTSGKPLPRTPADIWYPPTNIRDAPNIGYPLWIERDTKALSMNDGLGNCVSVERNFHDHPIFVDLECHLERAFACEKAAPNHSPGESVINHDNKVECYDKEYTIFNGAVTFDEAVGFCAFHSMSLASFEDMECTNAVALQMMRARPILENAWIGGRGKGGVWTWLHSGLEILEYPLNTTTPSPSVIIPVEPGKPNKPKKPSKHTRPPKQYLKKYDNYQQIGPGFPPFRDYLPRKKNGCLLLDRHECDHTIFLEARCARKKGFVCMKEKSLGRTSRAVDEHLQTDENYAYVISKVKKNWNDANAHCKAHGGKLAHITNQAVVTQLIHIMAESNFEPINHLWVSGQVMSTSDGEYFWNDPNENMKIVGPNTDKNLVSFWHLPWCDLKISPKYGCLNLDRENHKSGSLYGLNCKRKQHFICLMDKTYQIPIVIETIVPNKNTKSKIGISHVQKIRPSKKNNSKKKKNKTASFKSMSQKNDTQQLTDKKDLLEEEKPNDVTKSRSENTLINTAENPKKEELNDVMKSLDGNTLTNEKEAPKEAEDLNAVTKSLDGNTLNNNKENPKGEEELNAVTKSLDGNTLNNNKENPKEAEELNDVLKSLDVNTLNTKKENPTGVEELNAVTKSLDANTLNDKKENFNGAAELNDIMKSLDGNTLNNKNENPKGVEELNDVKKNLDENTLNNKKENLNGAAEHNDLMKNSNEKTSTTETKTSVNPQDGDDKNIVVKNSEIGKNAEEGLKLLDETKSIKRFIKNINKFYKK